MDILQENYGNINHPVAFSGISKIYDIFQGIILCYEEIKKLKKLEVYQQVFLYYTTLYNLFFKVFCHRKIFLNF